MEEFNKYDIIILPDTIKRDLIEKVSLCGIYNYKILSTSEVLKNYYFNYNKEAIYYLYKTYSLCPDVAKIYLDNLIYIDNDLKIENPKINYLKKLKAELEEKQLLKYNPSFRDYLKNKNILVYDCQYIDDFYNKLFKEMAKYSNVTYLNNETKNLNKKVIYRFSNKEDEIIFIAEKIIDLVEKNIDLNNIYLVNIQDEYYYTINKIFNMFGITVELDTKSSISGTNIVKIFKENFSLDINVSIDKIKEILDDDNKYIYDEIINILNGYSFLDNLYEAKDLIFSDIDNVTLKCEKYDHSVKLKNIDYPFDIDKDYVFICGFNEGVIPCNFMDEDYLQDIVKEKLGISTSIELNVKTRLNILNKIKMLKNILITYPIRNLNGELYISSLYSNEQFDLVDGQISFEYSDILNKQKLVSYKDLNKKYGTVTRDLLLLNNNYYDEKYMSYNNQFKGINDYTFNKYMPDKITLSYTSINSYYECAFKYYLQYILKVDKFDASFEAKIGSIFHEVLAKCYNPQFDLNEEFINSCKNNSKSYSFKEMFFLEKLKDELKYTIDILMKQKQLTTLNKAFFEKKIVIEVDENTIFKGFVDKVFYDYVGEDLVLMIVDYKTGNSDININYLEYGLNMQLPIYVYLFKNYKNLNTNLKIGGFYLQKIINNINNPEDKEKSLRLQGYSNSNTEILKFIDSTYNNSLLIKSLKTKTDGFYSFSKVLNDLEIDLMVKNVHTKIIKASEYIRKAEFSINPKEIDGKLVGCNFCKFRDICYRNNSNIIKIKSKDGEENGVD